MKTKRRLCSLRLALLLLLCLVPVCLLTACGQEKARLQPPEEAQVLTDQRAVELFMDPRHLNLSQLLEHQLYLVDGGLFAEFLFAEEATEDQLDRARSFCLSAFVLTDSYVLVEQPYLDLLLGQAKRTPGAPTWDTVTCRVYRGEELVCEDVYDKVYLPENSEGR
jgi:hypothetical protein